MVFVVLNMGKDEIKILSLCTLLLVPLYLTSLKMKASMFFACHDVTLCIMLTIDLSFIQADYYAHPEQYKPAFHEKIAPYASVIGQ